MMYHRNDRSIKSLKWIAFGVLASGLAFTSLSGCSQEEPVAVAPAPQPKAPPPPPAPKFTKVSELMNTMGIDERIAWDEANAPQDDGVRRAVLSFFDGFARADRTTVASMLPSSDGVELDRMVDTGQWQEATASIDAVEITAGRNPDGEPCVLALYTTGFDFQPQLWYYRDAGAGDFQFESVACPPNMMQRLQGIGQDRIASWFDILDKEAELAIAPEEDIELDKRKMYDDQEEGEAESDSGSDPAPGGPIGGNRRKPPTGPKRPAPSGPGFG
jgi:hypothetical protein